jgi:polysaccharide deacetylase family protein (PEP-CTERM system associated)
VIEHHFTVDVEEYFQVSALEPFVARDSWEHRERRLAVGMDRLLRLLDDGGASATFFVLGWVAERDPEIVRRMVASGHEVASHGYAHRLVYEQTPEEFLQDARKSKLILENIAGCPVIGYRSSGFSVTE